MQQTPGMDRLVIGIFGQRNAGKSSLFNAISRSELALVSDHPGSTAMPLRKAVALIGHGQMELVDTAEPAVWTEWAGAQNILDQVDLAVYALNAKTLPLDHFYCYKKEFDRRNLPYVVALTKFDLYQGGTGSGQLSNCAPVPVSVLDPVSIQHLCDRIALELEKIRNRRVGLLEGLVTNGGTVLMVTDPASWEGQGEESPQVQLIRASLKQEIRCHTTTVKMLPQALAELVGIRLIVADTRSFLKAVQIVPGSIPFSTLSILIARQKGDIQVLIQGTQALSQLREGDRVLIVQCCAIPGRMQNDGLHISQILLRNTGVRLSFDFIYGGEFPADLTRYVLVVHCGGCNISQREMCGRIRRAGEQRVPIVNSDLLIAYFNGILPRCTDILLR